MGRGCLRTHIPWTSPRRAACSGWALCLLRRGGYRRQPLGDVDIGAARISQERPGACSCSGSPAVPHPACVLQMQTDNDPITSLITWHAAPGTERALDGL